MTSPSVKIDVDYPRAGLVRPVTDEEREGYGRDGAYLLKGIVPLEWVDYVREAVMRLMDRPDPSSLDYAAGDGPRFFTQAWAWLLDDAFKALAFHGPPRDIAAQVLTGAKHLNLVMDQVFAKEPGTAKATPWHQDYAYGNMKGADHMLRIWMALDEVTADSGAVHYLKGSHRWGVVYHPVTFLDPNSPRGDSPYEPIPDFDADYDKHDWLVGVCEPGDAILHHSLTVHGGRGNASARFRRAVTVNYAGDQVTYEPRSVNKSRGKNLASHVKFPDLTPGGPIDSDLHPRVWEAPAA